MALELKQMTFYLFNRSHRRTTRLYSFIRAQLDMHVKERSKRYDLRYKLYPIPNKVA